MFVVQTKFFEYTARGTNHERRRTDPFWSDHGPFETRESAELFARQLACQQGLAQLRITEQEEDYIAS